VVSDPLGPGHLGNVEVATRVDGAAVGGDELAGLLAGEAAADPPDQVAFDAEDRYPGSQVGHAFVDGEMGR